MSRLLQIRRSLFRNDARTWQRFAPAGGGWTTFIGLLFLIAAAMVLGRSGAWGEGTTTFRSHAGWTLFAAGILATVTVVAASEWLLICTALRRTISFLSLYRTVATMVFWQNAVNHWVGLAYALQRLVLRHGLSPHAALRLMTVDQVAEFTARVLFTTAVVVMTAMPVAKLNLAIGGVIGVVIGFACLRFAVSPTVRTWMRSFPSLRLALSFVRPFAKTLAGRITIVCVALAIGKKLLKGLAVYGLQVGLNIDCPPATAWQLIVALDWATAVPVIPGHFGVIQAATAALYGALGYGYEHGFAIGTCYHLAHLAATLIPGALVSTAESYRDAQANRRRDRLAESAQCVPNSILNLQPVSEPDKGAAPESETVLVPLIVKELCRD